MASRGPSSDDGCGETMVINCTANPVENLFTPPTIMWTDPNGRDLPLGGMGNPRVDSPTKQLVFSDITEANSGAYMCRAVLNIPEAQIANHVDVDTIEVNTNCELVGHALTHHFYNLVCTAVHTVPGKVQNLMCAKSATPTELVLSWERPALFGEEVVDYRVKVKQLSHRNGAREVEKIDIHSFNTVAKQATISQGLGIS